MEIKEKVTVRHSFHFTEEDLELITFIAKKLWDGKSVGTLICQYCSGFAATLCMINRIDDSVYYNKDLTCDDDKHIDTLRDLLISFETKYPDDPRIEKTRAMWEDITGIRRPSGEY